MSRKSWLDDDMQSTKIEDYTRQLGTFVDALADGHIDDKELASQEKRVVALMKKVEPKLDDALHGDMTQLLCELAAYSTMQTLHGLSQGRRRPKTKFRG
jgi:hypothetical protein